MPSLARARHQVTLSAIAGLGIYRPPAGAKLAHRVSGSEVTGVSYRVSPEQGVNTASLAAGAARAALRAAEVDTSQLEMIVVGTTTPDVLWPSTACLVQTELKLPMVAAFDLYAAETSVLTALDVATRYVAAGARQVLVIGAESDNQLVDLPGQGGTAHGRAAAALVLTPDGAGDGVLATAIGGGEASVNGSEERGLIAGLNDATQLCLERAGVTLDEIDLVIGEQSAPEIMQAWTRHRGIDGARLLLDAARYGSMLAAAPLVVLHDAVAAGRLRKGMTALLVSCGRGPVWAMACVRWGGGATAEW
jgi:3-oxoacyl-[acyl-carrier-protein] synthase-3